MARTPTKLRTANQIRRESGFPTSTVYEKTAVMHPDKFAELAPEILFQPKKSDGEKTSHYQGMPVKISSDCPRDQVYIMDGRPYQVPKYGNGGNVEFASFVDEHARRGAPEPNKKMNPLDLLDHQIDMVCAVAR
jgi:hypothetical protein